MNVERIDVRAATWTPADGVQEVTPIDEREYRYDRLDISPARMLPQPFDSFYSAWDVSDEGTIAGTGSWSDLRYVPPTKALESIDDYRPLTFQHGMRWKNGQWDTLGSLRQRSLTEGESVATAINPLGTIVVGGSAAPDRTGDPALPTHAMRSQMPFHFRPFEPSDPALEDLAPLGDGSYSWAWDVDAAGDAVGYSTKHQTDPISQTQAAYWAFGSTVALELENLGGTNTQFPEGYGYANAINAAGDRTVGKSLTPEQFTAGTLWALNANKGGNDRWWEANDLNKQVPSGWYLVDAIDINNEGMIVGIAYHAVADPANPNGPPLQLRRSVLLIPVEFVEVTPKLKDESDNEIANSDTPILLPEKNGLVKEPRPGQIPNVAYRNLKIRLPNLAAGDKIKWSMAAQFIPTGHTNPVFRGQWPEEHPNRFEANGSDMYQFTTLTQAEAETAADSNGETAIRINLPPIGLNAATVTIEIEKYPGAIAEIDFIVPAIVVIDPGHGGDPSGRSFGGSDPDHAECPKPPAGSGLTERQMTLNFGLLLKNRLQDIKNEQNIPSASYLTRTQDLNKSLQERANLARDRSGRLP